MDSRDLRRSKSTQLRKMGQRAVASDECTAFGGATPRCTVAAVVAAAHVEAENV